MLYAEHLALTSCDLKVPYITSNLFDADIWVEDGLLPKTGCLPTWLQENFVGSARRAAAMPAKGNVGSIWLGRVPLPWKD